MNRYSFYVYRHRFTVPSSYLEPESQTGINQQQITIGIIKIGLLIVIICVRSIKVNGQTLVEIVSTSEIILKLFNFEIGITFPYGKGQGMVVTKAGRIRAFKVAGVKIVHLGFSPVANNSAIKVQFLCGFEISAQKQGVNVGFALHFRQCDPKTWGREGAGSAAIGHR